MQNDLFLNVTNNVDGTISSVKKLGSTFNSFGSTTSATSSKLQNLTKNLNRNQGAFRNLNLDGSRANKTLSLLNGTLGRLSTAFNIGSIYALSNTLAKTIQSSLDTIEVINMFEVSLGDLAVQTNETLMEVSRLTGLDLTNLQQATGTFNLLAKSMGLSAKNAQTLGLNSTKLALDMASLYNVPIEQVFSDMQSGLVGQTRVMYKYGIDLTEASLKQEALSQGITKSVDKMSQAEKMYLRSSVMVRQASASTGDFARTIESPANQLKVLGERFVTLGRSIGNAFIPLLGKVLPYVNAIIMVLTELFNIVASLFGYTEQKITNVGTSLGGVSDEVDKTTDGTKKLKKAIDSVTLGFDELNTISLPDTSTAGAGGGLAGGGLEMPDLTEYDMKLSQIRQKATDIRDKIMEWLGFTKDVDSETGKITWKLKETYTNLEKIRDIAILVGLAFLAWKIAPSLTLALAGLRTIARGIYDAFLLISGSQVVTPLMKLFNAKIAWAAVIALMVFRFYELWQKSEAFRTGLERIGQIFTTVWNVITEQILLPIWNILKDIGSAILDLVPENIKNAILNFFKSFKTLIDKLDLDFGDLLITLGGIGLLFTPAAPFGVALLIFEAITVAIRALGTVSEESFEKVRKAIEEKLTAAVTWAKSWFTVEKWEAIFESMKTALTTKWTELVTWWKDTAIVNWWNNDVKPWFTVEKWSELWVNIKNAFTTKWEEIVTWWKTHGAKAWIDEHVVPLFKLETWKGYYENISTALKETFKNGINGAIELVNRFIDWLNEKMKFEWDAIEVGGVEIVPAGEVQLFTIPKLRMLARGGMLQGGQSFIAGEGGRVEAIGSYQGKTTVMPLENTDFVDAMYNAIYSAVTDAQASGGQVIENVVNLDGEVLYKNQQKVSSQKGINFNLGAFAR